MIDVEELKTKAWAIQAERTTSRAGVVRSTHRRPPMSVARFLVIKKLLGWSLTRMRAELRVSMSSVSGWSSGRRPIPRTVELALMFCLIRDQPTRVKENSELLARIA